MFRQVGIGAAAVLTIGLLAAGCSEDGDTIIAGGGSLLQNQDSTPFSGITTNNLSPDGGGFSPNGANAGAFTVTFNCDNAKSDGTFGGDNSAIVLFTTTGSGPTATRVFASYFANSNFTPPVELEAADRDYAIAPGDGFGSDVLDGYICMPLNTATYQSGNSTPAAQVNTVRENNGNWVIIGDYVTKFTQPGQEEGTSSTLGKGARRTIGSWVFLKAEASNSLSTSTKVGGLTREFRYGFQRTGDEIATSHTTGALGVRVPANNVMSYGVASDGLCGQASWSANGAAGVTPFTGAQAGPNLGINGAGVNASGAANTSLANNYSVGESVSALTVLFTQIETTSSSDGDGLRRSSLDTGTMRGDGLFLRHRNFNLETLTWGTEARISTGISISSGSTAAGSGVFSNFFSYNNTVFFRYMDASMNTNATGFAALSQNTLAIGSKQEIIAATRFTDGGSGVATQAGTVDISTDAFCTTTSGAGTPGSHHTTVQNTNVFPNVEPSHEKSEFFSFMADSTDTQSIYGADEGLDDLTLFYKLADDTNGLVLSTSTGSTGSGPNEDAELAVVALPGTGTLSAATVFASAAGTNPLRISGAHAVDGQNITATVNNNLTDAIDKVSFAMNRTGSWIGVAFTRNAGVSLDGNFQKNLYANIYQTFRKVTSSTQAGATGGVAATMQNRVLASGPVVVDAPGGVNALTQNAGNGVNTAVNAVAWQGKACYRGWQSNKDVMSLFFEQSDGTGDRVFGARLTVATNGTSAAPLAPTLTNDTAVELNFTNDVSGDATFFNVTGGTPGTATFEWLNGNARVTDSDYFASCDAGFSGTATGSTGGNVYVTFVRVDDGTQRVAGSSSGSGDSDLGDVSIYATVFSGTAFETPVKIGTTADTNEDIGAQIGFGVNLTQAIATSTDIKLLSVDCLPNNTDITSKPSYPALGDSFKIVTSMQDRDGSTQTTATGATPVLVPGNSSGLLVPMFRVLRAANSTSTPTQLTVGTRMFPSTENTTASPFVFPVRLAHEAGLTTNLQNFETCQKGSTLAFVFRINSQVWYQVTTGDAAEVLRDGATGQINPGLITTNTSADSLSMTLWCCTDGNGDTGAAIMNTTQQDVAGTTRHIVADAQF